MLNVNLRKKIISLFLFFGLLPLAITFFLTITQIQKSLRETVNNNLASLVDEVVSSVEKSVRAVYADVELLSANPLIRSNEVSNEEKLVEIKRIQDLYGIFEDITLIDLDGDVIISTTYKYRGDWKNKQWYQEAKQGKSSISPAHIILGPFKVILASAAPVKDKEGKIIAVVAGQVNMETIWETTNDIKVGRNGFAFMINKEGRFVAHPEKERILSPAPYFYFVEETFSKNSGIVNYTDENKEKMIGGLASFSDPKLIEQLGWKVIIVQPESEAFALVSAFQRQVVVIFLGGLVLLFVISFLLSGKIVIPIRKLIMGTKRVAGGELKTKIEVKTGDEIEELAGSFNQMAENLSKSYTALEEAKNLAEQRAREIEERKAELERFYKLAVDRELIMRELKEKISALEGRKQ